MHASSQRSHRLFSAWLFLFAFTALSARAAAVDPRLLVSAARAQVGVTTGYDPAYRKLAYPGGDVPAETGVCCDVVIRALRKQGVDLQQRVHEDMRANFSAYPPNWGLKRPDPNIDHRRVPNLERYFKRQGWSLPVDKDPAHYLPGDVVTWRLPGGAPHIGVVSDRKTQEGIPWILHNIGAGAREEEGLFQYPLSGHYRVGGKAEAKADP